MSSRRGVPWDDLDVGVGTCVYVREDVGVGPVGFCFGDGEVVDDDVGMFDFGHE